MHHRKNRHVSHLFLRERAMGMDPYAHEYNKEVQTVLVPKKDFTYNQALSWIHRHGYRTSFYGKGVDVTENFYRFRQAPPRKGVEYYTETLPNGVEIVMYKL